MKKTILLLIIIMLLASVSQLNTVAESEVTADENEQTLTDEPESTDLSENELPSEDITVPTGSQALDLEHFCLCGRPFYTEDGDGHYKYDCVKCGKNMYLCACDCWCGAKTVLDTSGDWGTLVPLICTECKKPCILCDCEDDREAVLKAEEQRRSGQITAFSVPRPDGGLVFFAAVIVFLLFTVFLWLELRGFLSLKLPAADSVKSPEKPENKSIPTETAAPVPESDGAFEACCLTGSFLFRMNKKPYADPVHKSIVRKLIVDGDIKTGDIPDMEAWCRSVAAEVKRSGEIKRTQRFAEPENGGEEQ